MVALVVTTVVGALVVVVVEVGTVGTVGTGTGAAVGTGAGGGSVGGGLVLPDPSTVVSSVPEPSSSPLASVWPKTPEGQRAVIKIIKMYTKYLYLYLYSLLMLCQLQPGQLTD